MRIPNFAQLPVSLAVVGGIRRDDESMQRDSVRRQSVRRESARRESMRCESAERDSVHRHQVALGTRRLVIL